jgi:hypothetical protein
MKIAYSGHSSFAAEINGKHLAKERFRSKGLTLHLLPIGGTQDF